MQKNEVISGMANQFDLKYTLGKYKDCPKIEKILEVEADPFFNQNVQKYGYQSMIPHWVPDFGVKYINRHPVEYTNREIKNKWIRTNSPDETYKLVSFGTIRTFSDINQYQTVVKNMFIEKGYYLQTSDKSLDGKIGTFSCHLHNSLIEARINSQDSELQLPRLEITLDNYREIDKITDFILNRNYCQYNELLYFVQNQNSKFDYDHFDQYIYTAEGRGAYIEHESDSFNWDKIYQILNDNVYIDFPLLEDNEMATDFLNEIADSIMDELDYFGDAIATTNNVFKPLWGAIYNPNDSVIRLNLPYVYIPEPEKEWGEPIKRDYIAEWNAKQDLRYVLMLHGYVPECSLSSKFVRPHSNSGKCGTVVNYLGGKQTFYSFSASDYFSDNHQHTAFDVIKHFDFNDNFNDAFSYIKSDLGVKEGSVRDYTRKDFSINDFDGYAGGTTEKIISRLYSIKKSASLMDGKWEGLMNSYHMPFSSKLAAIKSLIYAISVQTNFNFYQVDEIFRKSKLYNHDKWDYIKTNEKLTRGEKIICETFRYNKQEKKIPQELVA